MQLGIKFQGEESVFHLEHGSAWSQLRAAAVAPGELHSLVNLGVCSDTDRLARELGDLEVPDELAPLVEELMGLVGVGERGEGAAVVEA